MTLREFLQEVGLNPEIFLAGALGGVMRAVSRRRFKLREMVASPICGSLAAAYLTIPVIRYSRDVIGHDIPDNDMQVTLAFAFLIGTCAMWISDILFEMFVRRFLRKDADEE